MKHVKTYVFPPPYELHDIFKRKPACTDLHPWCLLDAGVSSARMSHPLCWRVVEGPGIAHKKTC